MSGACRGIGAFVGASSTVSVEERTEEMTVNWKKEGLHLDWPCVTGVRVINLPPSSGPNSLFLSGFDISRTFPIY